MNETRCTVNGYTMIIHENEVRDEATLLDPYRNYVAVATMAIPEAIRHDPRALSRLYRAAVKFMLSHYRAQHVRRQLRAVVFNAALSDEELKLLPIPGLRR